MLFKISLGALIGNFVVLFICYYNQLYRAPKWPNRSLNKVYYSVIFIALCFLMVLYSFIGYSDLVFYALLINLFLFLFPLRHKYGFINNTIFYTACMLYNGVLLLLGFINIVAPTENFFSSFYFFIGLINFVDPVNNFFLGLFFFISSLPIFLLLTSLISNYKIVGTIRILFSITGFVFLLYIFLKGLIVERFDNELAILACFFCGYMFVEGLLFFRRAKVIRNVSKINAINDEKDKMLLKAVPSMKYLITNKVLLTIRYLNNYRWAIIGIFIFIILLMNLMFNTDYYLNMIRKKSGSFQITSDWEKDELDIANSFKYNFVAYQKYEIFIVKKMIRRENMIFTNRNDIEYEYTKYEKIVDDRLFVIELNAEYIWKNFFWCYEIDTAYFYKTVSYVDIQRIHDPIPINIDNIISEEEYRQLLEQGEIEVD